MKKNKNGFFLPETIVVISIVAVVLLGVFQVFSSVFLRYTETEKYNTVNSLNAVAAVQKYLESTSVNFENVLGDAYYLDITDNSSSEIFNRIKEEYSIDKAYLIDLNQLFQDDNIGVFNVTTRKYLETFNKQNGIILVAVVNGNEFASSKVSASLSVKLIGDESNEYAVYVKLGSSFVDPGYKNWNGTEPTKTWETPLDINQEGSYYLVYDFDGYLVRRKVVVISKIDFEYDYTGSVQTFTAPVSGTYQLEVWGAQGGGFSTYESGYGGYSFGIVSLNKNDVLYINVGGKGTNGSASSEIASGGYNGGGNGGDVSSTRYNGGGGGATHIATVSGLLSTLNTNQQAILIVAGGGGGVGGWEPSKYQIRLGGSGGGFNGVDGEPRLQSNDVYGVSGKQTESDSGGTFGQGRSYKYVSSYQYGIGGGGGGFYGGGVNDSCAGGGGSGYIGNSLLTNKVMYCYNCTTSSDETTKTISTTCTNTVATENCAKKGNGFARITLLSE